MVEILVRSGRLILGLAFVPAMAVFAATHELTLAVTVDGKPAKGLAVTYCELAEIRRAITDREGIARFTVRMAPGAVPRPYRFRLESKDYVLTEPRGGRYQWRAEAVRSAAWMLRVRPRPCDQWIRVMDIPRGMLPLQSAQEWDEWYASLPPRLLANCETLVRIEKRVGSKAPWYFYEFKAMEPACTNGTYEQELDWTAWYRRLLERSTGASPGKCLADWERWWEDKGYHPIPDRPADP